MFLNNKWLTKVLFLTSIASFVSVTSFYNMGTANPAKPDLTTGVVTVPVVFSELLTTGRLTLNGVTSDVELGFSQSQGSFYFDVSRYTCIKYRCSKDEPLRQKISNISFNSTTQSDTLTATVTFIPDHLTEYHKVQIKMSQGKMGPPSYELWGQKTPSDKFENLSVLNYPNTLFTTDSDGKIVVNPNGPLGKYAKASK